MSTRPLSLTDTTDAERQPMSEPEMKAFLNVTFAEQQNPDPFPFGKIKEMGFYKIFEGRFQGKMNEFCNDYVATILSAMMRRPGDAVLWAWTVHEMRRRSGHVLDIESLTRFFPMGFPTEEGMKRIWREQKGGSTTGGNHLDDTQHWTLLFQNATEQKEK